jgi:SAM-dependent methyltransferase
VTTGPEVGPKPKREKRAPLRVPVDHVKRTSAVDVDAHARPPSASAAPAPDTGNPFHVEETTGELLLSDVEEVISSSPAPAALASNGAQRPKSVRPPPPPPVQEGGHTFGLVRALEDEGEIHEAPEPEPDQEDSTEITIEAMPSGRGSSLEDAYESLAEPAKPAPPPERASVPPPPPPAAVPARPVHTDDEEILLDDMDHVEDAAPVEPKPAEPKKAAAAPPAAPPKKPPAEPARKAPPVDPPTPKKRQRAWFEDFFSDDYLRTVRQPKEREIAAECTFIETVLGLTPGATILDVGCGLGMHAIEMTRRGYLVVGLDLSLPMLSRAGEEAKDLGLRINFLHGDMREMSFDGAFDAVLCWGTTFGYFDDEGNKKALKRLHSALRVGGRLLLEMCNRDFVIRSQPNLVWFEGDGCICMEETKFNYTHSRLEVSRNVMLDDGRQREKQYSLRLYSLHELGQMLGQHRFRTLSVSGSTAMPGVFFGADSPRIILLAERRGEEESLSPPAGTPSEPAAAPPVEE